MGQLSRWNNFWYPWIPWDNSYLSWNKWLCLFCILLHCYVCDNSIFLYLYLFVHIDLSLADHQHIAREYTENLRELLLDCSFHSIFGCVRRDAELPREQYFLRESCSEHIPSDRVLEWDALLLFCWIAVFIDFAEYLRVYF